MHPDGGSRRCSDSCTPCPVRSCLKGLGMKTAPQAPTSGWKAWQVSGRRRSFWERILLHLTEALCAEVTVKVNTAEAELPLEPVRDSRSVVSGSVTPMTGAHQAPPSM